MRLYTDLKKGKGLLEDLEVGALVEEWLWNGLRMIIHDKSLDADVPSAASAPTLIATPRSIPTEPPKEDSKFLKSTFGSPAVPSTGVPSVLAFKVKSSPADASTLAKTVAFAAPLRISTPISSRGIKWASARPVSVTEAPTSSLIAIRNILAEKMDQVCSA